MKINSVKYSFFDIKKWMGPAIILAGLAAALMPLRGFAHGRWIIPSHTILSGEKVEYVALDFSISNDMFFPDMAYGGIGLDNLIISTEEATSSTAKNSQKGRGEIKGVDSIPKAIMKAQFDTTKVTVIQPDGAVVDDLPIVNLVRKSATAMPLQQSGTYRFRVTQRPVHIAFIKTAGGEKKRMFGHPKDIAPLLKNDDVIESVVRVFNNVDTYVTRNELTKKALTPTSQGLEIAAVTHPNELFVGEKATFRLMLNGKSAGAGVQVAVVRGGTRYRNNREGVTVTTDAEGRFAYSWPKAGMYFLEAEISLPSAKKEIATDVYALYLTLEVNP